MLQHYDEIQSGSEKFDGFLYEVVTYSFRGKSPLSHMAMRMHTIRTLTVACVHGLNSSHKSVIMCLSVTSLHAGQFSNFSQADR